MQSVSVGAFQKNVVGSGNVYGRVADNRLVFSAQVTRICDADIAVFLIFDCYHRNCRAENMTGIEKFQFNIGGYVHFALIGKGDKLIGGKHYVFFGKEGLPGKGFSFFCGLLTQILGIARLNASAVHHNQICQISGCGR